MELNLNLVNTVITEAFSVSQPLRVGILKAKKIFCVIRIFHGFLYYYIHMYAFDISIKCHVCAFGFLFCEYDINTIEYIVEKYKP